LTLLLSQTSNSAGQGPFWPSQTKCDAALGFSSGPLRLVQDDAILRVQYSDSEFESDQMITGENYFPAEIIAEGLGVSLNDIVPSPTVAKIFSGGKTDFLLVAMSYTRLLPILIEKGKSVKALDIWYNQEEFPRGTIGDNMRAFNNNYRAHLVGASALHIPMSRESVGHIWSYRLVSAQTPEFQTAFLREAIRVVKVGGEVRINGYLKEEAQASLDFINREYSSSLEATIEERPLKWTLHSNLHPDFNDAMKLTRVVQDSKSYIKEIELNDYLLVVKKKSSIHY
jgi:hypothetical protein